MEAASPHWQCTDRELVDALTREEAELRQRYSRILARVAELDSRGSAYNLGYSNTAALLVHALRLAPAEAKQRIRHAEALHDMTTPTGAIIDAPMPLTAEALQRGEIGPAHVETIEKFQKSIGHIPAEQFALGEKLMVEQAKQDDPNALARYGERVVRDIVDPDGKEPSDEERRKPERELRIHERKDGSVEFKGRMDPENGALLKGLLAPAEKREPDDHRTPYEKYGDTFADILRMAANCPDLPQHNGMKNDIAFTISFDWLKDAADDVILPGADSLTVGDIRRIACDAHILPAVMGGDSKPLDIAFPAYVVPAHMRRGLVLRDRGCTFPGCSRPAKACDSHHLRSWLKGGPTSLDNLVLLCPQHHRLVHRSEWEVKLVNNIPWFTPPDYVDPARQPRRNLVHLNTIRC